MRDLSLMPTSLIASVSGHFRQGQVILDALRRHAMLTAGSDAGRTHRRPEGGRSPLAAGLDRATTAVEKVDNWIARNGGGSDGARALGDLPSRPCAARRSTG